MSSHFLRGKVPTEKAEAFFEWLWSRYVNDIEGIDEGTVLMRPVDDTGLDADFAPIGRDWVAGQEFLDVSIYLKSREIAGKVREAIQKFYPEFHFSEPQALEDKDWNAEWKKSFQRFDVDPFWSVIPPWEFTEKDLASGRKNLVINPGAGFGTGTHETTRLCLAELGKAHQAKPIATLLDFGAGSGILAIAGARLGAVVDAIEIDPLALDNARDNAKANQVSERIQFQTHLPDRKSRDTQKYDWVVANILRDTLLQMGPELCQRVGEGLILSGLLEPDVVPVMTAYQEWLSQGRGFQKPAKIYRDGEWRALVFKIELGRVLK